MKVVTKAKNLNTRRWNWKDIFEEDVCNVWKTKKHVFNYSSSVFNVDELYICVKETAIVSSTLL